MPLYAYKAAQSSGKVTQSVIEAEDESRAVVLLQESGLIPIRIWEASEKISKAGGFLSKDISSFFSRIALKDVMLFTQDLSSLLEAGLPVDRSLKILFEATQNPKFKRVVKEIIKAIEGGAHR